jgi:hypothetical protein
MIDVLLITRDQGGEKLVERQWPAVPRVGEAVVLHDVAGTFEVVEVVWYDQPTGMAASVHLLRTFFRPPKMSPKRDGEQPKTEG